MTNPSLLIETRIGAPQSRDQSQSNAIGRNCGVQLQHSVVDSTCIEVLAVLPRLRILEDSYGLARNPIAVS